MKLRVFRPFFLSLNLPYSIVKGEAVGVQVLVHNYMNRDVVADVTLDNSANQFTFTEDENEVENSKPAHIILAMKIRGSIKVGNLLITLKF